MYDWLADFVVVVHLAFIVFALLGGLLVAWRSWLAWLHVPAALWIAVIAIRGGICPLTPLENSLRAAAGAEGYSEGFVAHYIVPLIYPPGLTPGIQLMLGLAAIAINVAIYAWVLFRHHNRTRSR